MPPIDSKTRPILTETPRFLSKRPSTARNSSKPAPDISSPSFDSSSRIFLTATQPITAHSNVFPSPKKIIRTSIQAQRERYSPPNRRITSPKKPEAKQDPEELKLLNLSMALLEVKDEHGNPLVRAIRKLDTDRFHSFLGRYRRDEEIMENKILQLQSLELDLKQKSRSRPATATGHSIFRNTVRQNDLRIPISHTVPTAQDTIPTVQDSSTESFSALKTTKDYPIAASSIVRPANSSHARARSAQVAIETPIKPQSAQGVSPHRPKTASKRVSVSPKRHVRPQTATIEEVKYGIDTSGLIQAESLRQDTESSQGERRQFFSKAPLFRKLAFNDGEDLRNKRPRNRPKSHILSISLNHGSTMDVFRNKMSSTGYDKWTAIHSKREIDTAKLSVEKSKRERTPGAKKLADLSAIKQWFDALTIKGSPVTPLHDLVIESPERTSMMSLSKQEASTSKRQRIMDRLRSQGPVEINGSSLVPKTVSRGGQRKSGVENPPWGKNEGLSVLERMIKGQLANRGIVPDMKKREVVREKIRKKHSLWTEGSSKELRGWNVPFTNENIEKGMHAEENMDIDHIVMMENFGDKHDVEEIINL